MNNGRFGIWLVGAWGGVATTVATGLAALQNGLSERVGLVSELPKYAQLDLADWKCFVLGGHEIRKTSYLAEARNLLDSSRVFSADLLAKAAPTLEAFDKNVRTGTLINVGSTIESFATPATLKTRGEPPRAALGRIAADLKEFRGTHNLDHVIVVNVASTEPPAEGDAAGLPWSELSRLLDQQDRSPVPASTLYAVAAMKSGCSYINFTPSVGSNLPALQELAAETGSLHMGRDGKTGETLLKSALAPMFAARNLQVKSWVGHNIFGNMDGKVLDDPVNKENKVRSKDRLLAEILGYKPQTLVTIEYIESMGDWKTAWDHIHFSGFLGTPMVMQFTWQGCDSLLAAPLVLDLVRFCEREHRRGKTGLMTHLCSFFKSPMGTDIHDFSRQVALLDAWAEEIAARP
jgi:myo-inositol-1-phosphate synthase